MLSRIPMFVIGRLVTRALFPDSKQLRNSRVFRSVRDVPQQRSRR